MNSGDPSMRTYVPTEEDRRNARGVVLRDIINKEAERNGLLSRIERLKGEGNPNSVKVQQLEATAEQYRAGICGVLHKACALRMNTIDEVHNYKGCKGIYVQLNEYVSAMCKEYGVNGRRKIID